MNDHACQPVVQPASGPSIDPARLIEANINPVTGLATDYLNHFNEAIMMLELIPAMPECVDDLMGWRVMSYCEHFMSTHQKHRDLVLAAYDSANPEARRSLDELTASMDAILTATRNALQLQFSPALAGALAKEAAAQLKPLVAQAGAVINGLNLSGDVPLAGVAQAAVDAVLRR